MFGSRYDRMITIQQVQGASTLRTCKCVLFAAGFYEDFARVADDEARHFGWCVQRMAELGHRYSSRFEFLSAC
jgi:hypothetical protein